MNRERKYLADEVHEVPDEGAEAYEDDEDKREHPVHVNILIKTNYKSRVIINIMRHLIICNLCSEIKRCV